MPLQQIPAEKKLLVFCELAEWWSLVSPNRVLLVGLRKCPRIVCPMSQGCCSTKQYTRIDVCV